MEWAKSYTLGNTLERAEQEGDWPLFIVLMKIFFLFLSNEERAGPVVLNKDGTVDCLEC